MSDSAQRSAQRVTAESDRQEAAPVVPTPQSPVAALSLHRHAFREIPGLVDVAAAADTDVVGKQLEWDDHDDRGEQRG